MNKPTFQVSSDTRFIFQTLSKAQPGDTVTYEVLSDAIGRDVRKHARSALYSAVRMQIRENRVFEATPNVGYRLLTDDEIIKTQAAKGLSRISRTARTTARKVAAADFAKLDRQQQVQHNTQLSMLGAVGHLSKPTALNKLSGKVTEKMDQLAVGETLKLMTQ